MKNPLCSKSTFIAVCLASLLSGCVSTNSPAVYNGGQAIHPGDLVRERNRAANQVAVPLPPTASKNSAQSLGKRAASLFEDACLTKETLLLVGNGDLGMGIVVVKAVGSKFYASDKRGDSPELKGTPRYKIDRDRKYGTYTCSISAKGLTTNDLLRYFDKISKTAGKGMTLIASGPAAFDGDPTRFIEGKRHTYKSIGRELILESFFFRSKYGPLGAHFVTIKHRLKQ